MEEVQQVQNMDIGTVIIIIIAGIFFIGTYLVGKNLSAYNITKRRISDLQSRRQELKGNYQENKRKQKKPKVEKEENIEFIQKIVKKLNLIQEE